MSNRYEGLEMPANTNMHQHCLNTIQRNFIEKCKRRRRKLVQEMEIIQTSGNKEKVPDLSYWDVVKLHADGDIEYSKPRLTIEITHSAANDAYSHESILEVFRVVATMEESFIYNYEQKQWTRYSRSANGQISVEKGESYSEVIKIDLNELLKW